YLGKKVSQADLAAIAGAISDLYRAAGFHLSRAIVPPQDIRDGRVRIQVIEGSVTEVALRGDGAEQFGIRPMLSPLLAECPSRLATLERQLLLVNGRPGVRIVDTAIEEIGGPTGRFRLVVYVKTWHIFTSLGIDNLGSSSVGPWQTYATAAFNSYLLPGDTLALNLSTTANDPRELAFGRLSYDVPVGTDGLRIGASTLYSDGRPGDDRRLYNDSTTTEAFEGRGSIVPLQSQWSWLTLTAAFDFSNVGASTVFGQLASGRLLLSQQFYLGGLSFGGGYGSAEISGDNGIAGSFELRFDQKLNYRYWSGYQLYSFVDAGAAWNDGFGINDGLALTSAGGGVRFFLWDSLQAD